MPIPRSSYDGLQIRHKRSPSKEHLATPGIGYQGGRIATPARPFDGRNGPATQVLDGGDDLPYRVSAASTQIYAGAFASREKVIECIDMSSREIADMNIVAHRGAI